MSLVQVRLARDSLQTPWGFRLQGGKDLNQALTVQRVFANTPSERELQRGDIIVAINGRDTTNLSHKQAQDAISAGGGQIEFLVQRPLGPINIKPLTPAKDTRAPAFPQSPTRAPQINIPIHQLSGPKSPTRIIPISPQKPSAPVVQPSHGYDQVDMASSGFKPKKVTLNKYGGGGMDFGSSYGTAARAPTSPQKAPSSMGYRPVVAPAPTHVPVPMAEPTSPISRGTIEYQTQFSAPQRAFSPQKSQEEGGVESEDLGGVGDRRRNFMQKDPAQMHALGDDDIDYPTAPVWERRKKFGARGPPKQAVKRTRKPPPTFGRGKPAEPSYATFGVDYTKPQPPQQAPSKHATQRRERPPPVNRQGSDDLDSGTSWSNTLRPEGRQLKPWEREAMEQERYQSGTVDQPYRPHTQPAPAPKPKIVQISGQSSAPRPVENSSNQLSGPPPAGYRSVSPVVPPKPVRSHAPAASGPPSFQPQFSSPQSYGAPTSGPKPYGAPAGSKPYQPVQQSSPQAYQSPAYQPQSYQAPQQQLSPNAAPPADVSGSADPSVVHLQYNSPIGLYSRDNIRDTYVGQTAGRAQSPSKPVKPVIPGERDWNDSYLAQMVQSNDRRGHPGQGHEGPRSPPQQQQQRQPAADYKFDAAVGMSDF